MDLYRDAVVALQALEHLQPAAPAVAPQPVAGIGHVLELLQDELRDDERGIEDVRFTQVGEAAVNHGAGVHDDRARALFLFLELNVGNNEPEPVARLVDHHHTHVATDGHQGDQDIHLHVVVAAPPSREPANQFLRDREQRDMVKKDCQKRADNEAEYYRAQRLYWASAQKNFEDNDGETQYQPAHKPPPCPRGQDVFGHQPPDVVSETRTGQQEQCTHGKLHHRHGVSPPFVFCHSRI